MNNNKDTKNVGKVYLVGGGPGDPELLTMKAHRALAEADAVVYDRLVSDAILDLIPAGTTRVFVGKQTSNHTMPQEEINSTLVNLALSGHTVARLKGGDPYVFGRGSEEAIELAKAKVPFEVVPGITAAAGAAASIGVPLTHRGMASGVRFVTGHCRSDIPLDMNWKSLADPDTTLVVYMGLANASEITAQLMYAGLDCHTPAIAVSKATTPEQKICRANLSTLVETLGAEKLKSPVLIIIGKVASLADIIGSEVISHGDSDNDEDEDVKSIAGE